MKSFFVILAVLSALAAAEVDITRGVLISGRAEEPTAVTCSATDFGMKCNSCTTYIVCSGTTQLGNNSCSSPNGFCDSVGNQCSSVRPSTCTETTSSFVCPDEGFFPNPTDCQTYFFCDSSKTAAVWQCPENYVYDALNGYCKRRVYATDCVVMTCTTAGSFIVHKANPNFYAFCDNTLAPILFKCPTNMQFDAGCRYICKAEGYFAGKSKSEAYHCARSGVSWVVTIYNCPTGYEYNSSFNCVKIAA